MPGAGSWRNQEVLIIDFPNPSNDGGDVRAKLSRDGAELHICNVHHPDPAVLAAGALHAQSAFAPNPHTGFAETRPTVEHSH